MKIFIHLKTIRMVSETIDYSLLMLTKLIEIGFEIEKSLLQFFKADSTTIHCICKGDLYRILRIDRFFIATLVSNFDRTSDTSVIESIDTIQIPVGPR